MEIVLIVPIILMSVVVLVFGTITIWGVRRIKKDHIEAEAEKVDQEWARKEFQGTDRNQFELWRLIHEDNWAVQGLFIVQDQNRVRRAELLPGTIQGRDIQLKFFPQAIGSGFVGEVKGTQSDSLVIQSQDKAFAEAIPQLRSEFAGFDVKCVDGDLTFEWLDQTAGLYMPGGFTCQVSRGVEIVAVCLVDLIHSRSNKHLFAFHKSLTEGQRLAIIAVFKTGNYRGIYFGQSEPQREINNSAKKTASLRERYGPFLAIAILPAVMALLLGDFIFLSHYAFIDGLGSIMIRIWPTSIVAALIIGYITFLLTKGQDRTAREVTTYFIFLFALPTSSAVFYFYNCNAGAQRVSEQHGVVTRTISGDRKKNPRLIVDYESSDLFGKPSEGWFGFDVSNETISSVRIGHTKIEFRVHEGALGFNWFTEPKIVH